MYSNQEWFREKSWKPECDHGLSEHQGGALRFATEHGEMRIRDQR